MDEIDKVQLKLEGRCIHCKEKLPEHLEDCKKHPRYDVLNGIKNVNYYLKKVMTDIAERADNQETRKQLEEIIVKIKK